MERLVLCSKVLYDIDIIEKQKRILKLEKLLEEPKLIVSCLNDWEEKYELLCKNIKKVIEEDCLEDREYHFMFSFGITPRQCVILDSCLHRELYALTKDSVWSYKLMIQIRNGLGSMFSGLMSSLSWESMYLTLGKTGMNDIVYSNIISQLNNLLVPCKKISDNYIEYCKPCYSELSRH